MIEISSITHLYQEVTTFNLSAIILEFKLHQLLHDVHSIDLFSKNYPSKIRLNEAKYKTYNWEGEWR